MTMAAQNQNQQQPNNLAPKAFYGRTIQEDSPVLPRGSASISPITGATVNGDRSNSSNSSEHQHHHHHFHFMDSSSNSNSGGGGPLRARTRTSSHDGLPSINTTTTATMMVSEERNRARTNSGSIIINNNNNNNNINNPGGSADTRRRITKLSKAREREKVPRLVEYFCVVSSVPLFKKSSSSSSGNNSNTTSNSNSNSNSGTDGVHHHHHHGGGNIRLLPTSSPRAKNITKISPMPHTPYNNDTTSASQITQGGSSNSNNSNSNNHHHHRNSTTTTNTPPPPPPPSLEGSDFQPVITSRYPLVDHEENPLLPDSITAFCYPSGKIPIITTNTNTHNNNNNNNKDDKSGNNNNSNSSHTNDIHNNVNTMPKVHYFVTTGESGQKMYGTCLTIWEGHEITLEDGTDNNNSIHSNMTTTTTTQVVYLPKCLVILSMHPYLVAFREYLTQLHLLTLPIERYITNFCSELPAPPPGSFQVQTTILDSVISIWSPPHNMPIAWVSLPFSHLFQCLDVENVLTVWTALALERQVLVTSTQLSLLTTCCEILLSLLFPMKWSHAYIPVLPYFLVPILSAPMPFLCGIDKRHLASTMEDLADECIVVDLDKNMVSLGTNTRSLPRLPRYIYQRLKSRVEAHAGHVHREVRSLRKEDDTSEMGIHLPPDLKSMADAMWESRLCLFDEAFMLMFTPEERRKNWLNGEAASSNSHDPKSNLLMTLSEKQNVRAQSSWDAVQEAFLDTYCFLLQKYRKFLVFPSKHNEGSYGGAGFRSQEFLAAQRSDVRDFLEELVGSQMFDDFVTKRLYGSGEADISFFDSAVDRYVRNNGLVANVRGMVRDTSGGGALSKAGKSGDTPTNKGLRKIMFGSGGRGGENSSATINNSKDPPMLQSARVKRELMTIVPPEPCGVDLPDAIVENGVENGTIVHITTAREEVQVVVAVADDDDTASVASNSTAASTVKQAGRVYYHYPTFPEHLNPDLFGTPRPLSSAVRAEYDRQRENVGKFRQALANGMDDASDSSKTAGASSARSAAVTGQLGPVEKPATSEVTTFTVFFMTFTAVVGKDLMAVDNDSLDQLDSKSIISTYKRERNREENEEDGGRNIADLVDAIVMDADLPQTPTKHRPQTHSNAMVNTTLKSPVRHRFNDKLSTLKIMEAKETAKAELVIAFEMLKMMKERGLRADPEAFQCLIDACGRCGDTGRATQLLQRMHEDGIVADGLVYSSLVSAFSADNAWKQASGEALEELPDWAAGASLDMDWNTLKIQKRSYIDIVKEKLGANDDNGNHPAGLRNTFKRIVTRSKSNMNKDAPSSSTNKGYTEQYVTDQVLRQILLGENLLEIVYPDISIDTDNEFCPRCNFYLSDDDVVAGWSAGNSQEYKTECPNCLTKFVPHFCVQSTLPSFVGSRGPSSALFCERLSPWVLKKELRSVISGGIEDLLSPEWRERESKNAVLWWNLILSFMRYRFPFTFLLQGSFSSSLIAPTPDADGENQDI
ncbi:hypothetical protein ACHAXH_002782 [Discostella pseudostelligera]